MPELEEPEPRLKLLISYDVVTEVQQEYVEFVMREFIPKLQEMGLPMTEAWHTAYGNYPLRMAGFVAPNEQVMTHVLRSDEWRNLQRKLNQFVTNLEIKVVAYKEGFQF
jgi:hypothetical protein